MECLIHFLLLSWDLSYLFLLIGDFTLIFAYRDLARIDHFGIQIMLCVKPVRDLKILLLPLRTESVEPVSLANKDACEFSNFRVGLLDIFATLLHNLLDPSEVGPETLREGSWVEA